jgi:hypothetical protein
MNHVAEFLSPLEAIFIFSHIANTGATKTKSQFLNFPTKSKIYFLLYLITLLMNGKATPTDS